MYAQDSWRCDAAFHGELRPALRHHLRTLHASGRSQLDNPALLTLEALQIPLFSIPGAPHDYRKALRAAPGNRLCAGPIQEYTVIRAGFGLFYNDLAQNGWVTAFQAVNEPPGLASIRVIAGCLPGAANGGAGALIDPAYKTPYALHASAASACVQFPLDDERGLDSREGNTATADTIPGRLHALLAALRRQMSRPNSRTSPTSPSSARQPLAVRRAFVHLQANVSRFSLVVNYTLSSAETWGCVLGELFDYVNGVCNPLNAFAKGRLRAVGRKCHRPAGSGGNGALPGGFEFSRIEPGRERPAFHADHARGRERIWRYAGRSRGGQRRANRLDEFRGTPYIQTDVRVSRPFRFHDRWR
jgi:hypothetical protein